MASMTRFYASSRCWAAALLLAASASGDSEMLRPAEAAIMGAAAAAEGGEVRLRHRTLRSSSSSGGGSSSASSSRRKTKNYTKSAHYSFTVGKGEGKKGGKNKNNSDDNSGVAPQGGAELKCERDDLDEGERIIYETVDFEVDYICGTREDVASKLEEAFLSYFQVESNQCDSDRDVESLVLVDFTESNKCESRRRLGGGGGGGKSALGGHDEDRELQNIQRSRGRFNRRSVCSRCRRRLEEEDEEAEQHSPIEIVSTAEESSESARYRDLSGMDCGAGRVWSSKHGCVHTCNPDGCANPCTQDAMSRKEFYHPYCRGSEHYIQCDEFHGCFVKPCPSGLVWSQEDLTCVLDYGTPNRIVDNPGGNKVPGTGGCGGLGAKPCGSTTTTTTTTESAAASVTTTTTTTTTTSTCPADLVQALQDAGFDDVTNAEIPEGGIKEVDCSPDSKQCTSEGNGVCCGACGCSCSVPSKSLCEAEEYCIEQARPFDCNFCVDFAPGGKGGKGEAWFCNAIGKL